MNRREDMDGGVVEAAWNAIQEGYDECHVKYPMLIFNREKYELFKGLFEKYYEDIMSRFMQEGTTALDTHKQAAILTICCLKENIIEHKLDVENELSIVPQTIAINVALTYMKDCMNDTLKEKKIGKKIEQYYMPVAIACDTPYQEIMCRILYHEQNEKDMSFNVLELADRYFLLEYINLLQRGIEPHLLKA